MAQKDDTLKPIRPQPKIEGINPSCTLGLKTQLLRRQQELAGIEVGGGEGVPAERRRYAGVDLHELRKEQANSGVADRAAHDEPPETWSERLAYSQRKLQAKAQLYDDYERGRRSALDDCDVSFEGRGVNHADGAWRNDSNKQDAQQLSERCDGSPATRTEPRRASPSYEPYSGREAQRRTDHDAQAEQTQRQPHYDSGGSGDEEWRWGRGDDDMAHATDREQRERKFRERQARDRALNKRVEELEAAAALEKGQRAEKRKAEIVVVNELAEEAAARKAAKQSAAAKTACAKRELLNKLVEAKVKKAKAAQKAAQQQSATN